jgi:hypothetical protein
MRGDDPHPRSPAKAIARSASSFVVGSSLSAPAIALSWFMHCSAR